MIIVNELLFTLQKEKLLVDVHNPLYENLNNIKISGRIQTNSNQVEQGDIFACIKGYISDGHNFAAQTLVKGACLLIVDHKLSIPILQLVVTETRKATAIIARELFGHPTSKFDLIGVTGTNGKSTTSFILYQLFMELGCKTGLIGTLGYQIGRDYYPSDRTTPDILELNQIFSNMVSFGCEVVIMEVSSHAIALDRVYGLNFRVGVFTNLSHDHLDFHQTMEEYGQEKLKLFKMVEKANGVSIINLDDVWGRKIKTRINSKILGYQVLDSNTSQPQEQNLGALVTQNTLSSGKTIFNLQLARENYHIESPLSGVFNIYNLTAALLVLAEYYKHNFPRIVTLIKGIKPIPGRMQRIENQEHLEIYVDYAHSPEALEMVLKTAKEITNKRIICVFGCGGNRDHGKRTKMGRISIEHADLSIITSDNPRSENPADIIRDITEQFDFYDRYVIIQDRSIAIRSAILLAQKGDLVIVAGKGHETYQEIKGIKHFFDDVIEIKKALNYRAIKHKTEDLAVPIDILNWEKLLGYSIPNSFLNETTPLFTSISTDSRTIKNNSLFIALKGLFYDGADYVDEVINQDESIWCIISDPLQPRIEKNKIFVPNTITFYGAVAKKYLQLFATQRIVITGSTGKTTSKEILFNILSCKFKTFKSKGNENNQIGVPRNIFRLCPQDEYAIFEIGTNYPGEIDYLSNLLTPEYGLIISVNPSHLEGFHTITKIRQEKMSLLDHIQKIAIIPEYLRQEVDDQRYEKKNIYYFGTEVTADFRLIKSELRETGVFLSMQYQAGLCKDIILQEKNSSDFHINPGDSESQKRIFTLQTAFEGWVEILETKNFPTQVSIPFYSENITLAIAISRVLGISNEALAEGLQKELINDNRMEIVTTENHKILYDCYNANPTSMGAAITFWSNLEPNQPHYAILGEMRELGDQSSVYHAEITLQLENLKEKLEMVIIGIGEQALIFQPDYHFPSVNELIASSLLKEFKPFAIILIKGSNSLQLTKLKGII